jgi:signal-transduction protein with cAMP-binding, CBS, and nucleotidyltransferase domain
MTESPEKKTVVERGETLSEEMLNSIQAGQRTAMDAVRKFGATLDEAIPNLLDESARKKVIGAALDMIDQLVAAQLELLREAIGNVGEALHR